MSNGRVTIPLHLPDVQVPLPASGEPNPRRVSSAAGKMALVVGGGQGGGWARGSIPSSFGVSDACYYLVLLGERDSNGL